MNPGLSHSPLLRAVFGHAVAAPDKVALISCEGDEIRYSRLRDNVLRYATFLSSRGIKEGDRIMISAQKDVEFIYAYLAAHFCGAVNVVVDALNNSARLGYMVSATGAVLGIGVEAEGINCIGFRDIPVDGDISGGIPTAADATPDSVADIMFTSGTTGMPKGVTLSHANIYASACNINSFIRNGADEVEFLGLPVCHSFGLGRLRCNLVKGATVVLHNGFANLKSVFSAFERYRVTGFGMVPAIWAYIKRFSGKRIGRYAPQIRYVEIGSAPMPVEDKELLAELFPGTRICMHYGLTEASRSLFMEFHEEAADLSTIGRPVCGCVDVRIMSEEGRELPDGEEGELCVRGNMVTKSYLNASDNEGAFFGEYFRTGDGGVRSADGRFFLKARIKEIINVGGKKVSPVEIEDALSGIGVGESMCVAMKDPEGVLGEVPKALLVKGTFAIGIDEIKGELRKRIEEYKMPRVFEVVDSIPKTSSGKKQRTKCRN